MLTARGTAKLTTHSVVDVALRLTLIAILAYACYRIARPFLGLLLWTTLLAVMLSPLHVRLRKRRWVGNRTSAVVIGIVGALLVLGPILIATDSLVRSALKVVAYVNAHGLVMPERPVWLERVPLIGHTLRARWDAAAADLPSALQQYRPQIREGADWLGRFAGGLAGGVAMTLMSLAFASALLAYTDETYRFAAAVTARVTGDRPRARVLIQLTAQTIRAVVQGVVGVAFIQAVLVGIGFFTVGISFAGALSLLAFVFGILQIPVLLITLPAVIYVAMHEPTSTAVMFGLWSVVAGASDNILKPFMLGRGLDVPMPLILIGVIGGLVVDGMIGLFTGPVILAVGHVLFQEWLREEEA